MTDLDLILNCYASEAQRYAPDGYRIGITLIGAIDQRLPPPSVTLSVSAGMEVVETAALKPADLTRERVIETFAVLVGRAMAAKMAAWCCVHCGRTVTGTMDDARCPACEDKPC